MTEIRISPKAQIAALLVVLGAIAAAVGVQVPEVKRYLNIERM